MSSDPPPDQLAAASPSGNSDHIPTDNLLEWLITLQSQLVALHEVLLERGLLSPQELDERTARARQDMFPQIVKGD